MPTAKSKTEKSKTEKSKTEKSKTKKDAKAPDLPNDWSYEDTLARIEDITGQLESGDLPLAEVFEQFSDAVIALQQCDQFLQSKQTEATLLIETLVGEDEPF